MPKIRNLTYDNTVVEQPVFNDVPLKKWINIQDGQEYVIWEAGEGHFKYYFSWFYENGVSDILWPDGQAVPSIVDGATGIANIPPLPQQPIPPYYFPFIESGRYFIDEFIDTVLDTEGLELRTLSIQNAETYRHSTSNSWIFETQGLYENQNIHQLAIKGNLDVIDKLLTDFGYSKISDTEYSGSEELYGTFYIRPDNSIVKNPEYTIGVVRTGSNNGYINITLSLLRIEIFEKYFTKSGTRWRVYAKSDYVNKVLNESKHSVVGFSPETDYWTFQNWLSS